MENCFNWMMNQIIKSLHGKWLEITISIHFQLAVWGSRMVCLFVFLLVHGFFKQKSKSLYFDIMKSTMCFPQVDIDFVLNLGKQNRKKTKEEQRRLPQKKHAGNLEVFYFFWSTDPSILFGLPFFFFWRCQRLMWWVTWRRTWHPEASFVRTRIPRFCQTGGGVKQKKHEASMPRWMFLLVVIHIELL